MSDKETTTTTICPKCGRESWTPYVIEVRNFYGKVYRYRVYRHRPHGNVKDRRPVKHNVPIDDSPAPAST